MIKDLKLVVADIDGTLVNDAREMLDITKTALSILHRHGVMLGIASGRPLGKRLYSQTENTWKMTFDFDMYIGMNGGQIHDVRDGSDESFYQLQPETIREIVEFMSPVDANPFIYIGEDMLAKNVDDQMFASMRRHGAICEQINDLSDFWAHETPKILFRIKDPSYMPEVEEFVSKHPSDRYSAFKTQPILMEFQDSRVNKGLALRRYCEKYGIRPDEVMAFGDMTNDNELLKAAGWGVCLKNGSDDTKASADEITEYTNNEDGMGRYLMEHWIIPNHWQ